jgi:hypothetical protein
MLKKTKTIEHGKYRKTRLNPIAKNSSTVYCNYNGVYHIDLGGEESGFEFLAIPIMVVISTAFLTINKLANLYGEPFSENKTSVTIDEICKTIECNCNEIISKL